MISAMTIGRLVLPESDFRDFVEKPSDVGGGRNITLAGEYHGSGADINKVDVMQQSFLGLYGQMVPVVFSQKSQWNGFYYINTVGATLTRWDGDSAKMERTLEADLAGFQNDIDLESRLGGPQTITNPHSATGERWHAPPPGHTSYWVGNASPSVLTRQGS